MWQEVNTLIFLFTFDHSLGDIAEEKKTTEIYGHSSIKSIQNIKSPFDEL